MKKHLDKLLEKLCLHSLDLYENLVTLTDTSQNKDIFYLSFKKLMIMFEGIRHVVYDDKTGKSYDIKNPVGNPTIGIGCNLRFYGKLLPQIIGRKNEPRLLDLILHKKYRLSDDEINLLFIFCMNESLTRLNSIYGRDKILKLPSLITIVLLSLSFNSGRKFITNASTLINGINIYKIVNQYFNNLDLNSLVKKTISILLSIKHPKNLPGLTYRRNMEAAIISLYLKN